MILDEELTAAADEVIRLHEAEVLQLKTVMGAEISGLRGSERFWQIISAVEAGGIIVLTVWNIIRAVTSP